MSGLIGALVGAATTIVAQYFVTYLLIERPKISVERDKLRVEQARLKIESIKQLSSAIPALSADCRVTLRTTDRWKVSCKARNMGQLPSYMRLEGVPEIRVLGDPLNQPLVAKLHFNLMSESGNQRVFVAPSDDGTVEFSIVVDDKDVFRRTKAFQLEARVVLEYELSDRVAKYLREGFPEAIELIESRTRMVVTVPLGKHLAP